MKDKLGNYLSGKMSDEERQSFEHHLLINGLINQIKKVNFFNQKSTFTSYSNWKLTLFLILVFSTIFILTDKKTTNENLFVNYYQAYKFDDNIINRLESTSKYFINGIKFYNKGYYKKTINQFEEAIKTDTSNVIAYFLLGISFMEEKNYQKAINNLLFVINQNDDIKDDAKWYLALCYLKTNQIKSASLLFDNLANRKYYQPKAKYILKKLR